MVCKGCGATITELNRRTVGIATEIDFCCTYCKKTGRASADSTNYIVAKTVAEDSSFLRRATRIDHYDLNWRLAMATQLMGESQVGDQSLHYS